MLELVLILPVYMLILFVLVSLAEYGQVATELHLASRYVTWGNKTPDEGMRVFLGHFNPRATSGGPAAMVPVMEFDGQERGKSMTAVGTLTVSGVASYADGTLNDPLYGGQGAVMSTFGNQTAGMQLPAQAAAEMVELAHLALDGDTQQPGGESDIPWLQRHYAVMTATYKPMGKAIPPQTFQVFATVLRPRTYGTTQPPVYPDSLGEGTLPPTLRATWCMPIPKATSPVTDPRPGGHQMRALRTPALLDHTATPKLP